MPNSPSSKWSIAQKGHETTVEVSSRLRWDLFVGQPSRCHLSGGLFLHVGELRCSKTCELLPVILTIDHGLSEELSEMALILKEGVSGCGDRGYVWRSRSRRTPTDTMATVPFPPRCTPTPVPAGPGCSRL